MKILTLNTWQELGPWRERWEIIFKGLQEMKPDIVFFQEVFNPAWAAEIQKRSGYPAMAFPKEPGGLLTLSRFPVQQTECLTLKTKSPTEDYSRYVLFAELKTEKGPLAVFNTHWSWKLMESPVRRAQAEEFLEFTRQKAGKIPKAAGGDFNTVSWAPEIRKVREAGWTDTFAMLYPEAPGLTWENVNSYAAGANHPMPDRRIDYIFTQEFREQPRSGRVVYNEPSAEGHFASDHYGVLITFD